MGFLQEKLAEIESALEAASRGGSCAIGVRLEIPPRKRQLLTAQGNGAVAVVDPNDEQFWLIFHWPTGNVSRVLTPEAEKA